MFFPRARHARIQGSPEVELTTNSRIRTTRVRNIVNIKRHHMSHEVELPSFICSKTSSYTRRQITKVVLKLVLTLSGWTCNAIYKNSNAVHIFCSSLSFQQAHADDYMLNRSRVTVGFVKTVAHTPLENKRWKTDHFHFWLFLPRAKFYNPSSCLHANTLSGNMHCTDVGGSLVEK